jgi:hypothetical protein
MHIKIKKGVNKMKTIDCNLARLMFLLAMCSTHLYSQTNSKGLSLKAREIKTVEENGVVSWQVKTILTNHTHDTLFYFSTIDCEPGYYLIYPMVDSVQLFTDFKKCDPPQQTVIAVPPGGQRKVDLKISSVQPVRSPFKFLIFLHINKAMNSTERIPEDELMKKTYRDRYVLVKSNKIRAKIPTHKTKG